MEHRLPTLPALLILAFVPLLAFASGSVSAQQNKPRVDVTDPEEDGFEVYRTMTVKGVADIPSGHFLWVLARRVDFDGLWWPQSEGKIDPGDNTWKVAVNFGGAQDIGWEFDVATIVVAEREHILLKNYRKEAMKTGDFRPIEMPRVGAAPVYRVVKKIGH